MTIIKTYRNNEFELDLSDPDKLTYDFEIQLASTSAIILYPSLCTPILSDGKAPLRILLLTKDSFHATHTFSQQKGNQQCERMVQRFLHARAWPKGKGPQPKLRAEDNLLLYHDTDTAIANINVHYLGQLTQANRLISNSQGQVLARIDDFAIGYYNQHQFHHLFEIELNQFPALSPCNKHNLIDLNWIELDQDGTSKSAAFDPTSQPAYIEQQDELLLRFHDQRIKAKTLHAYQINNGELQFEPDLNRPLLAHHPVFINPKPAYNFGHLTDVHISSRQHVFDKSNAQVIPAMGALGGSERIGHRVHRAFDALYALMKEFGANMFADGIVFTGDLIDYNRNYNPGSAEGQSIRNTAALWQAMNLDNATDDDTYPNGIDNLIFYSLVHWFYTTYQKPIFLCAGNHEAYSVPYGISPRIVLTDSSALKEQTQRSPDAELPLPERIVAAIQRSIKIDESRKATMRKGEEPIEGTRANEGIPADHNLTIYEACLMYGPQYYRTPMQGFIQGSTIRNFQAENLDWFQLIFTPFADFSYQWPRQTLTLLAWGDDEVFMITRQGMAANRVTRDALKRKGGSYMPAFSALPRATRAIDDDQKRIMQQAIAQPKPFNILAAHFTLINYHMDLSFHDKGAIGMGSWRDGLGYFDWGTFDINRDYIYRDLLRNRRVQVTLSGHSHRAGLYQLDDDLGCQAVPMRLNVCPGQVKIFESPANRPRILVSACGGPIAVQNYCDELAGKGMERPSGSLVRFDALGDQPIDINVLEATSRRGNIDTAKPRFCVAVDFVDLLKGDPGKGKSAVFDSINILRTVSGKRRYGLLIRFSERMPTASLVEWCELNLFTGEFTEQYALRARKLRPDEFNNGNLHHNQYWLDLQDKTGDSLFDKRFGFFMQDKRTASVKAFLSVKYSGLIGSFEEKGLRVYQQYDFESPWIFPVEIEPVARKVAVKGMVRVRYQDAEPTTFNMFRHPVWGEIPEFGWYQSMDKDEYGGSKESARDNDEK